MKGEKRHGRGTTLYSDKLHEGYYLNDKEHGRGRIITISGNIYVGQLVSGLFEGTGEHTKADGSHYKGQFYRN